MVENGARKTSTFLRAARKSAARHQVERDLGAPMAEVVVPSHPAMGPGQLFVEVEDLRREHVVGACRLGARAAPPAAFMKSSS